MAKVIMVQGTMSNAGKSLVVAGLCRVFKQDGYRVAPFKSQNMALNSYVSEEGLEMGRAQAMQAEAAGIGPSVYMNPILLKPTNDCGSQVIVNGQSIGNMPAREYFAYKKKLIPDIINAFRELEKVADIIVIEGAGSPAEINLKENDIVNMGMAKMVDAPVLLVGDIDRGGVFAQLLGTLMLLEEDEKNRVKGLVINKFRGDKTILDLGITMLEEKGGIPVTGVLPYTRLDIDDEDSLSERLSGKQEGLVNIGVIRLPRLSNFTDFNAFEQIPGVKVIYIDKPQELERIDMVIVPGSKNTIGDMRFLKESGLAPAIIRFAEHGPVFGICGGYQMLGQLIEDPDGVEEGGSIEGLGLLPMITTLQKDKTLTRVKTNFGKMDGVFACLTDMDIEGYEIHAGLSRFCEANIGTDPRSKFPAEIVTSRSKFPAVIETNNVYGSYIHGIFDAGAALAIAKTLAEKKGVSLEMTTEDFFAYKEKQYDLLADMIRNHMDMEQVYGMLRDAHISEE